ncbi:LuxR C-terminal-related transcriptional regulator [Streptomyces sp. NPDC057413]|uniref:LuxR family transcriptional regulator AbsR2 n=1 Tax=Streptomyces sp. NPDC057413 TaxID=3346124 RepID=UPI0036864FA7
MTPDEPDAPTPRLPWPFTGRDDEREHVRRSLAAGRPGLVVTGGPGHGKTRLAAEAVRGTDRARITGTPGTRRTPYAAFAPLLPGTLTPHEALARLGGVRQLVVDDAQWLDDASAALVHQLAVHGRTRLLVLVTDTLPAPAPVTRLWTGGLLPRLTLAPLPAEDTARLLTAATGRAPDPLTAARLHRVAGGDLRLLHDLLDTLTAEGRLTPVPDTGTWAWRGPLPVTAALRERAAGPLERACPAEREILDRLAFAEPLPLDAGTLDLPVLERLEAAGLIDVDEHDAVRLARPLHGPVLRATAGRLRARRLSRTPDDLALALKAETAALERRIDTDDVTALPTPVGEWLAAEGASVPAGYTALRARFARLRGDLREAAAWARLHPDDPACRSELTLAAAQSGDPVPAGETTVWCLAARGELEAALDLIGPGDAYDAVRLGAPERARGLLAPGSVFARHADALAREDGAALDRVAGELAERGFLLFAAEAYAQAVPAHRDPAAARTARTRAAALARRCPGARTPALTGLALGELTARQRQIVTLAAAGLTNRQIAERLTLSVRTVGNHLYSAYTRLGSGDRDALPWLVDLPEVRTA